MREDAVFFVGCEAGDEIGADVDEINRVAHAVCVECDESCKEEVEHDAKRDESGEENPNPSELVGSGCKSHNEGNDDSKEEQVIGNVEVVDE